MNFKCNAYQAKNGRVYLSCGKGRSCTALTLEQISGLRIDPYSLDEFSYDLFRQAYSNSLGRETSSILMGDADAKTLLEHAIEAMLEKKIIRFQPYAWCFGMVDMTVTSEVFTDTECTLTVLEDDWNGGPAKCVARELAWAVLNRKLDFISPGQEEERSTQ